MVKVSSAPATEFTLPEEDVYLFRLTEVGEPETRDNTFYDSAGKDKDKPWRATQTQIKLTWTIEDPSSEFHGENIFQWYNLGLGTIDFPSKLRPFIAALTAAPVDDSIEYDFDELVDRKIKATLRHQEKKSGGKRAVIESPMALRVGKPRGTTVPATQPAPQTFDDIPFDPEEVPY